MLNNPFLWNFVKKVPSGIDHTSGQERPLTETIAEENSSRTIKTD